eukprot:Nitzschia sp. Nitz4//scaffold81_size91200//8562//11003//NITZ4_004974-RA/size91200-processed-gene-0.96-mRNA-1//1//CDS//3329558674//4493//frame0
MSKMVHTEENMETLRISLAYNEMTVNDNGVVMEIEEKRDLRYKHGLCTTCKGIPVRLYAITRRKFNPWAAKQPLNEEGQCENGVCFVCHPEKDPSQKGKRPKLPPSQTRGNSNSNLPVTSNHSNSRRTSANDQPETSPLATSRHTTSNKDINNGSPQQPVSTPVAEPRLSEPLPERIDRDFRAALDERQTSLPVLPVTGMNRESSNGSRPEWGANIFVPPQISQASPEPPESSVVPRGDLSSSEVPSVSAIQQEDQHSGTATPPIETDGSRVVSDSKPTWQKSDTSVGSGETPVSATSSTSHHSMNSSGQRRPMGRIGETSSFGDGSDAAPPPMPRSRPAPTPDEIQRVIKDLDPMIKHLDDFDILADVLAQAMTEHKAMAAVQAHCLGAIWDQCKDSPSNQHIIIRKKLVADIVDAMQQHPHDLSVQRQACGAIWSVASDEVNRMELAQIGVTPTGLTQAGVCHPMVSALEEYVTSQAFVRIAIGAMCALSLDTQARKTFEMLGASASVVDAMVANRDCAELQRNGCAFLSNCAINVEQQYVTVAPFSELDAIVQAMSSHRNDADVMETACFALKNYTHDENNCRNLRRCNGFDQLLDYASGLVQRPDCIDYAEDIKERMQLAKVIDESLEEDCSSSMTGLVSEHGLTVQALLDFLQENSWSPKMIVTGLRSFREVLETSPRSEVSECFARNLHKSLLRYSRQYEEEVDLYAEICPIFQKLVSLEEHRGELVEAGACDLMFRGLEVGKDNISVVASVIETLEMLISESVCRRMVVEQKQRIAEAVEVHAYAYSDVAIRGACLLSSLEPNGIY